MHHLPVTSSPVVRSCYHRSVGGGATTIKTPPVGRLYPRWVARCTAFSVCYRRKSLIPFSWRWRSSITEVIYAFARGIQMTEFICFSLRAVQMKVPYAIRVELLQKIMSVSMSSSMNRSASAVAASTWNATRCQRLVHLRSFCSSSLKNVSKRSIYLPIAMTLKSSSWLCIGVTRALLTV